MKKYLFYLKYIGFALIVRFIIALWFNHELNKNVDDLEFGVYSGDSFSYIEPIENYLRLNVYRLNSQVHFYAGRSPGYSCIYLCFRSIFEKGIALQILVILQVVLGAISVFLFALVCKSITKSQLTFYVSYLFALFSTYICVFDLFLLTESLAISLTVILLYIFFCVDAIKMKLVLFSFLSTILVMIKPAFLPIVFILALNFYLQNRSVQTIKRLTLAFIPLFFFTLLWSYVGYKKTDQLFLYQSDKYAGYQFPKHQIALYEFIQSWGGDIVWWNPVAEISFFFQRPVIGKMKRKYESVDDFPDYIYTRQYKADSIELLASNYQKIFLNEDDKKESERITRTLNKYKEAFIHEHPIYYYIWAPIRLLGKFIFHHGTYNQSATPFIKQNILQKAIKIGAEVFFQLIVFLGFIGSVFIIRDYPIARSLIYIMISYIILFCIVFRMVEYRYFVIIYLMLGFGASIMMTRTIKWLDRKIKRFN